MIGEDFIHLSEAAPCCGVDARSLRRWAQEDGIDVRSSAGGAAVARKELRAVLARRGLPVPDGLRQWPRIAVIEDEEGVSRIVTRIMQGLWPDAEIRAISDGRQAASRLPDFEPDLLLVDLCLPGLGGLELCRMARSDRRLKRSRVLVLTGDHDPDAGVTALESGADEFMTKPFSASELSQAAARLLD